MDFLSPTSSIVGSKITISYLDFFRFQVDVIDEQGLPYVLGVNDVVSFCIYKIKNGEPVRLDYKNPGETFIIVEPPTDLPPKTYDYDLRILFDGREDRRLTFKFPSSYIIAKIAEVVR